MSKYAHLIEHNLSTQVGTTIHAIEDLYAKSRKYEVVHECKHIYQDGQIQSIIKYFEAQSDDKWRVVISHAEHNKSTHDVVHRWTLKIVPAIKRRKVDTELPEEAVILLAPLVSRFMTDRYSGPFEEGFVEYVMDSVSRLCERKKTKKAPMYVRAWGDSLVVDRLRTKPIFGFGLVMSQMHQYEATRNPDAPLSPKDISLYRYRVAFLMGMGLYFDKIRSIIESIGYDVFESSTVEEAFNKYHQWHVLERKHPSIHINFNVLVDSSVKFAPKFDEKPDDAVNALNTPKLLFPEQSLDDPDQGDVTHVGPAHQESIPPWSRNVACDLITGLALDSQPIKNVAVDNSESVTDDEWVDEIEAEPQKQEVRPADTPSPLLDAHTAVQMVEEMKDKAIQNGFTAMMQSPFRSNETFPFQSTHNTTVRTEDGVTKKYTYIVEPTQASHMMVEPLMVRYILQHVETVPPKDQKPAKDETQ